ncbi:Transcriptional regulator, AraC family [Leucobacter sp. 7(1)]|uniref:AraC-like ligand-binding domain-containing protein n=1 Tax=Leucobacter sp. 7(1) TaxID=1255613 RepID=UPI00097F156B|nr:helix-turn-helix domain-containing protein [Leucobacter sp. 7(1)]SJN13237.1 Transcriptional regulator, AraC family [Leucobacter sp. 7(1)]
MQSSHTAASLPTRTHDIDAYQRTVAESFVPLRITPTGPGPFAGTLRGVNADEVAFTEVRARPQLVERTAGGIARGGAGYIKVSLLLAGSGVLIQNGREAVMRPGDICFYDTSQEYSLLFDTPFSNLIMMFPKQRLEFPAGFTDSLTAVSLGEQHPLADAVAGFITNAAPHLHELTAPARTKLAHTSVELLNSALAAVFDVDAPTVDPHQALLREITGFILTHLRSPSLSPDEIAAAHFISTRHLHTLFQKTGTSVSAWIKERRLEKCRADLLDPAHAGTGVAAIAASWGFPDAAHFSRNFRAAYGVSPRELRSEASAR